MLFGQESISVRGVNKTMSQGSNDGLQVFIPEANYKDVERSWKKYIKEFDAKVSSIKREIFADNATVHTISENTIDVYASVEKADKGSELLVFFDLGGAFVNDGSAFDAAKKLVYKFALETSKAAVQKKIDEEEKTMKRIESEMKRLERDKEMLEKNIEKWQESIVNSRKKLETNVADQENKKIELAEQTRVIEAITAKMNNIK